jgi:hypothetical protein
MTGSCEFSTTSPLIERRYSGRCRGFETASFSECRDSQAKAFWAGGPNFRAMGDTPPRRPLPRSRRHLLQFVAVDIAHVLRGVARILALEMDVIVRRPLDAVARRPILGSSGVCLVHLSAFQVGDPIAVAAAVVIPFCLGIIPDGLAVFIGGLVILDGKRMTTPECSSTIC